MKSLILGTVICVVAATVQLPAPAKGVDSIPTPAPPGRMIDIGGRRLHISCSGKGKPTVILIHGAGAFSFDWSLVQPQITANRSCSYDRAGHAWSDPAPTAQSYAQMSDDLHELLARAGEKGPFLLVGHSAGGEMVRVFTAAYPRDVAGAVLVDTGHPDALRIINGKLVRVKVLADLESPNSSTIARAGSSPASEPARIQPPYDRLPAEAQRLRLWCESEGKVPATTSQAEVDSVSQLRVAHSQSDRLFGEKPLIVISRAKGGYRPIPGVVSSDQAILLEQERLEHNADLLNLSKNSKALVADESGHDIHLERPDLVVSAIQQASEAIRRHSKLQPQ